MSEHTQTLADAMVREVMPDGWQTTITDGDRVRQLSDQDTGNLDQTVDDYRGNTLTERNIVDFEVQRVLNAFLTPDRTMELPGTALEYDNGHLHAFASQYKESDDTPTGIVKSLRRAQSDDLVFTPVTPEVINSVAGLVSSDPEYVENFRITGNTAGDELTLLGDGGFDSGTANPLSLDDDERLFFTGDLVDLESGQSILTRSEWQTVDNKTEDYGPIDSTLDRRLSGTRLGVGVGAYIKREGQLQAKVYEDGATEPWPVGFYMAPGHKAPDL